MPLTYREVEQAFVARIAALDASAYQQHVTTENWHESLVPLSVALDRGEGHLAFTVAIQSAGNTGLHRDAEVAGEIYVVARAAITFGYRLRAGSQVADARLATDAAHDVTRMLMAPWPASPCPDVAFVEGLQPSLTPDGEWLLVNQIYEVRFDLALSRSS
ncbi:MAG: hypothetical protein AAF211_12775 [Myxococcota bacterium]